MMPIPPAIAKIMNHVGFTVFGSKCDSNMLPSFRGDLCVMARFLISFSSNLEGVRSEPEKNMCQSTD